MTRGDDEDSIQQARVEAPGQPSARPDPDRCCCWCWWPCRSRSASSSASPAAGQGATFRVGWLLEPDNLNPFIGLLGQDYEIWHLNYDFLVGFDAKDLSPKPELAESWTVSADGKTWTFKIRQGVKWQDGQPLTAKDVAFTYNYIVKNDLQTLAIYTGGITGAVATDDYTVDITTDKPKSNMLAMVVPIIPEHIWSKVSGKAATTTYQNEPPIIGSGPFQTVEWSQGKYIRMVANKDYWGGKPKVDELFFENYKSADTMTADLKQGAIDAAVELPQAQYPSVRQDRRGDRPQGHPLALQRARLQLLRLAGLDGQPRAARPEVPAGAQLGDRPAEDRRRRLLRPGRRRLHAHRAVLRRTTGSRPPTRPTSTTRKRPRRSSTSPATRTRTATASARPRTASR